MTAVAPMIPLRPLARRQAPAVRKPRPNDIRILEVTHEFEDFKYRAPYQFGGRTVDDVTLLNVHCRVRTGSGREATELGTRARFDVLLTDLGLPDIPGDVVIRQIAATAARRPRIVVVTGYEEPFVSRAREAGADVVLTKPIAWSTLLERLVPGAPLAA